MDGDCGGKGDGVHRPKSVMKGKGVETEDDYVGLAQLQEGSSVAVKVMVCRKWDATNSFGKYLSTEYILSDLEGNSIQCSARNNISHCFVCKLHEGSVYSLKNFSVLPNKDKFRVRRNDPLNISLEGYTVVNKLTCDIERFDRFPFELIPLEDVEVNDSTYLIDIIGCVADMGTIRTTRGGSELIKFEIVNEREARMRVTLWAPLCYEILKRKGGAVGPYVVILPGMNVKEFRGEPYLSNTSATTVFDASDMPQIAELLGCLRKCNVVVCPVKPSPPAAILGSVYQLLRGLHSEIMSATQKRNLHQHSQRLPTPLNWKNRLKLRTTPTTPRARRPTSTTKLHPPPQIGSRNLTDTTQ